MEKWNSGLDFSWVSHLELQAGEGIHEALAYRTPAQVSWYRPVPSKKSPDVRFHHHAASALWAGLSFVETLIGLYESGENILVPVEEFEDLSLVHLFEDHLGVVYLNGGSSGLPN